MGIEDMPIPLPEVNAAKTGNTCQRPGGAEEISIGLAEMSKAMQEEAFYRTVGMLDNLDGKRDDSLNGHKLPGYKELDDYLSKGTLDQEIGSLIRQGNDFLDRHYQTPLQKRIAIERTAAETVYRQYDPMFSQSELLSWFNTGQVRGDGITDNSNNMKGVKDLVCAINNGSDREIESVIQDLTLQFNYENDVKKIKHLLHSSQLSKRQGQVPFLVEKV